MKRRQILFDLLFIIAVGLIPFFWFRGKEVILGHDAGLTLSPVSHLLDRLYAWTERFGFGNDQTYAIPGFFIHGLEAIVALLGFDLQATQKLVFIFWFLLPGLTMYYFAWSLSKRLDLKYFALPVSIFYMLNHFLLQGWFVAERTKFSLYAALPLVMAFLFDWKENRRSTFKTSFLISITLFFLNGEASLPLFGGLILSVMVFVVFYFIPELSWRRIRELSKLAIITVLISAFLNAYWLLPYGQYILQAYGSAVTQAGGLSGVLGWIDYVSANSSLYNMFRLQGIPEWYLNNLHPYASIFLNNPILILFSLIIPIVAFLPLYLIKDPEKRKKIIFFSFLALFAMVFMGGSHRPFGAIYVFLVNFFPGFIAFRNPFYKFAPALWFSYAILIGFTIDYFFKKIELLEKLKKLKLDKVLPYFLYAVVSIGIVLYSFPFLTGSFFDYMVGERSMRTNVPQYVLDFGKWSESPSRINTKTLTIPPPNPENKFDAYNWGYWSLSPLTSLLTNAPIINESNYMSAAEVRLIETLYKMIKDNEPGWQNLARTLGIKSFLLRKDFEWNLKGSPTDKPEEFEEALKDSNLVLVKKFGEWEVYDLKEVDISNAKSPRRINYLVGDVTDLGKVSSLLDFNPEESTYVSGTPSDDSEEILKIRHKLFLVPACVSCNLQHKFINIDLFRPLFTRDSIFYPLIEFKDKLEEKKLISTPGKINYYLYKSLRNILAFERLLSEKKDSRFLKAEIEDYEISLESLNKPLADYLSAESIDNSFLLELSDVLRIEKTIILRVSDDISDREVLDLFNEKYTLLEKTREKIDSNLWRTTDEINKKFLVISNENQQFNLFYRPNTVGTSSAEVNLVIDDKDYTVEGKPAASGWLSLGEFFLSKGLHRLSIKQFQENLYQGPSSVQLNSSSNFSCFSSNRIRGNRNDIYRISFEHKRLSGSKKFFVKIMFGDSAPNPLDTTGDILNSTSVWDSHTSEFALWRSGTFYLSICNPSLVDKENFTSTVELKNISMRKLTVPDVVFYTSKDSPKLTQASVEKQDQTKYSAVLPNSGLAVVTLNESFSPNWELQGIKGTKFAANGYANGWLVSGSSKGTIIYKTQDFVKIGFAISFLTFVASFLIFLIKKYFR